MPRTINNYNVWSHLYESMEQTHILMRYLKCIIYIYNDIYIYMYTYHIYIYIYMGITYFTAPTQCFQVFYVCTFQRCCARFTLRRRNSGTRWRPERPPGCHQSSQTQVIGRNMGDLEICVVDRCKYYKMNHRYHPGNMFPCFLGLLVCMYIYIYYYDHLPYSELPMFAYLSYICFLVNKRFVSSMFFPCRRRRCFPHSTLCWMRKLWIEKWRQPPCLFLVVAELVELVATCNVHLSTQYK